MTIARPEPVYNALDARNAVAAIREAMTVRVVRKDKRGFGKGRGRTDSAKYRRHTCTCTPPLGTVVTS
jgi:hypothetical protein